MMCNCHLQYSNVPLSCPTVGRGRTCRTSQCAAPAASLVDLEPFSELAPKVAPLRLGARALPGCLRAGGHCVGRGARRRIVRAVQLEREARAAATPPAGGPRRLAARRCHPGWRPCVLARVSRWHDRPAVGPHRRGPRAPPPLLGDPAADGAAILPSGDPRPDGTDRGLTASATRPAPPPNQRY